ncbi:hypothetical protein ABZ622_41995 [Streptomyces sp. NPDC007164]|uniref:hypothetical protein n=1 Tax=Streptomyces sp. NPDC007164 TaxID=3156918 RepID=UPI0033F11FE7
MTSKNANYPALGQGPHERYLDLLSTTLIPLGRVERFPDRREEWIEKAHKRWDQALKYRQNDVKTIGVVLSLDATRPVADAALEVTQRFVVLSGATRRAIEALKGQGLGRVHLRRDGRPVLSRPRTLGADDDQAVPPVGEDTTKAEPSA